MTPNLLSFLRMTLTIPIIVFINFEFSLYALGFFLMASLTDFFDGYLARKNSTSSEFGAFLDLMADKILVVSILIWSTYLFSNFLLTAISLLIILREVIISAFRHYIVITKENKEITKVDRFGKLKTTSQFIALSFLIIHPALAPFIFDIALSILFLSMILSYISLINYFIKGMRY
tara:strand:+ start:996 stop:1523 length:528 start_codon:yes stop_codon:yes gene_type:complete